MRYPFLTTWALLLLAMAQACSRSRPNASPPLKSPGDDEAPIGQLAEPTSGKVQLTDDEWHQRLTPRQYYVLREKGTEQAFTGAYWNSKEEGVYTCAGCGNELFDSKTKFDSGTGWPSYWAPLSDDAVRLEADDGLFLRRTEVLCSRCDGHLGHVFDDGPPPTRKRYCINSAALGFVHRTGEASPGVGP